MLWAKIPQDGTYRFGFLSSNANSSGTGLNISSDGSGHFDVNNGDTGLGFSNTFPIGDNIWSHIAVCKNGDSIKVWVNGSLIEELTGISSFFSFDSIRIGIGADAWGTYVSSYGMIGLFDAIDARTTEITQTDVDAHDNGGSGYEP